MKGWSLKLCFVSLKFFSLSLWHTLLPVCFTEEYATKQTDKQTNKCKKQFNYLDDTFSRIHVCVNLDIVWYVGEGWSVIICINHNDIDRNWWAFLHTIWSCDLPKKQTGGNCWEIQVNILKLMLIFTYIFNPPPKSPYSVSQISISVLKRRKLLL